jgi:hypothetical protein
MTGEESDAKQNQMHWNQRKSQNIDLEGQRAFSGRNNSYIILFLT